MKEKKKYYLIALAVFIIALSGYFIFKEDDVKISNIQWHCDWEGMKGNCIITYEIENVTNDKLFQSVHIRAQRVRQGGRSGSVEIVGEKLRTFELPPFEPRIIEETLVVDKRPSMVIVIAR